MRPIKSLLVLITLLLVSLSLSAQKQKPIPKMTGEKADQFEEVHRGIFTPQPNKAAEAGRFTQEVAKALPGGASAGRIPRKNFIDEYIFGRIERDRIPHAGLSSDEEFIRRVYIDATGLLPPVEVVREFLASTDPNKRDKLIDSVIGAEEFAEQWAWFYGDLFRLNSRSGHGKNAFHYWIKEWLRTDRPYSDVVADLLTPVSKSHSTIPALAFLGRVAGNNVKSRIPTDPDNYFIMNRLDTLDEFSVDISRIFLGLNTDCVSCHDGAGHLETVNLYLSRKTREEFYGQAAFFGKTRIITFWDDRSKNVVDFDYVIDDLGKGYNTDSDAPFFTSSESRFPRSGGQYEAAFFLTGEKPRPGTNPRAELARMLTEHIQFSRATANLIWGRLMTAGFVEPYDAFDLDRLDPKNPPPAPWTIQPNFPELLEALAQDFKRHNYSMHHLLKTIMKSSAYQLSSHFPGEWKDSYSNYYARRLVRVMTGPEVVDAIAQATGRPGSYNLSGIPMTRVKQLTGPGDVGGRRGGGEGGEVSGMMQSFFQTNRFTPVPTGNKASTLQAMMLMSSKVVNDRVLAEKGGRVQQLLESDKTNEQVIEELFLASLARRPNAAEKEVALQVLEKDRKRGAENLQWALLNGIEFILNH